MTIGVDSGVPTEESGEGVHLTHTKPSLDILDVFSFPLDQDAIESLFCRRRAGRATARKRIKHRPAMWRDEAREPLHKGDWLDRRVFAAGTIGAGRFGAVEEPGCGAGVVMT